MMKITLYIVIVYVFLIPFKNFGQNDTLKESAFLVSINALTGLPKAVITDRNESGVPGRTIFDKYYRNNIPTETSVQLLYNFKFGMLMGINTVCGVQTIYGLKLNNYLYIGYTKKIYSNFYIQSGIGVTYYRLTYLENKVVGTITYPEKKYWTDSLGMEHSYYENVTKSLSYEVHDFYFDSKLLYKIKDKLSIGVVFSLTRERAYSRVNIPREGIGTGATYNYLLYLKNFGITINLFL